jgi:hypothetical protein
MVKMNRFKIFLCIITFISLTLSTRAQEIILKPVLSHEVFEVMNRTIIVLKDQHNRSIVNVKAQPYPGIAWIKGIEFQNGIIEFDVKGKDVLQESFVGIAFHGMRDSIYEAVYFRPFNFHTKDPIRRKHAVQYIAVPENDWPYLRENFPDKYEAPLSIPVDPNDWFHVKIIIHNNNIKTFINGDPNPALIVESLHPDTGGKIGFWTGHKSDGYFSDLVITREGNSVLVE